MRRLRVTCLVLVVASAGTAACSAILGLDPPPAQDAGVTPDATTPSDASVDGSDGGTTPDSTTTPPVCALLDAGGDAAVYTALDDPTSWELFPTDTLSSFPGAGYIGGTFDGRFLYFAGRSNRVARYDTMGGGFSTASAWTEFAVSAVGAPGAFAGAAFDGRYVYFVPGQDGLTYGSIVARYDTLGAFTTDSSWATFDLSTLSAGGGAVTSGMFGAVFDGRFLYFVPHFDGAPDGRVVRYDTSGLLDAGAPGAMSDAGDAGDAGDGGATSAFDEPSRWSTFDVSSTNGAATGFAGGVFAAGEVYFAPGVNDVYDAEVHSGGSGIVARYTVDAGFGLPTSWSTFDTTLVNGIDQNDLGGAFDGRYVYFIPHTEALATRFDTMGSFSSIASWSTYDTTRVAVRDGGLLPGYAGGAFDGRFIYLVPGGSSTIVRYDVTSTFTADCAWSTFDSAQLDAGDASLPDYFGAVFDGQYLYLVPYSNGLFARFDTRSPGPLPSLPAFYGSFL